MFDEGDVVLVHGLQSKPSWNGQKGVIVGPFQWQQARYPIKLILNGTNNEQQDEKADINDALSDTTVSALLKPANLKLIQSGKTSNETEQSPWFDIRRIEGKGFGMFARKEIPAGTIILRESAVISLPKEEHRSIACEEWIETVFNALSNENQQNVLALHNNLCDDEEKTAIQCVGVYRTNAYMFTDHDTLESGLFLNISRINHSCFPNAQFIDDSKNGQNAIVALYGISKGEEITHSYIGLDMFMSNTEQRQEYILANYGFQCDCPECTQLQKRDKWRAQYRTVEAELEACYEELNEQKLLQCGQQMAGIIKKHFNGYPSLLSQAYMTLAEAKLHSGGYDDVVSLMKKSARLDLKYYGKGCDFNDIRQCRMMLPTKYQNEFPWDHVLES